MTFQRTEDVLAWYESEERVLSSHFLQTIPWSDIKKYPLDPKFLPVLRYMRDVEKFTEIYVHELRKTPTAQDPVIARFLERWSKEEDLHGELLNRFLVEAGMPQDDAWFVKAKANIPLSYRITSPITTFFTNFFGHDFTAVHMTWGAIQELSTLSGYERLWTLAKHPVLEHILRGIVREEARHALFYWSVADIKLKEKPFRQKLARVLVDKFWTPVGQGAKRKKDTNYVISTLFQGPKGIELMDRRVNQRIEQLPGFMGDKVLTNRIAQIA